MTRPRALLFAAGGSVLLWGLYVKLGFAGFMGDPVWYVDAARNWAMTLSLVAKVAMPAQVSLMPSPAQMPTHLLLHGPLGPLLFGAAYWLFGVADWVPIALNAALTLATGLLIWRVGSELAGERVGVLAAALFWTNYEVLTGLTGALTDPPFILLVTASWAALWRSSREERHAERWLFAAGLALAAASACRLAAQSYWAGFVLAAVWLHGLRPKRLGAFAGGLALGLIPLMLYSKKHLGVALYSPGYYALCWSPSFPGFRAAASYLPISSFEALARYPLDFLQKAVAGPLYASVRLLGESGGGWWLALAALSLCARHVREIGRFRALAALVALPVFAFNAVFAYGGPHYLTPLFPPLAILAAIFLFRFLDENGLAAGRARRVVSVAVLAWLLLAPVALRVKDEAKAKAERARTWRDGAALAALVSRRVDGRGVVWTDSPHLVAWQADRPAIGLTATPEDGERVLEKLARPPELLLLTSNWLHNPDFDESWREAFREGRGAFGYDRCEPWKGEAMTALLCARAP